MTELKRSTEAQATDVAIDGAVAPGASMAQALVDRKAAVARKQNCPPFPAQRENHKAKRIGNSPRGTRRSMGKR